MKETESPPRQDACALYLWLTSCWYLHLYSPEECDVLDFCARCVALMWWFLLPLRDADVLAPGLTSAQFPSWRKG